MQPMKPSKLLALSLCLVFVLGVPLVNAVQRRQADSSESSGSALDNVIKLLVNLENQIKSDAKTQEEAHHKYQIWCEKERQAKSHDVKMATKSKDKLEATIEKAKATIGATSKKIEELTNSITTAESDLDKALAERQKEAKNFAADDQELVDAHDAVSRAIQILKDEAKKQPALLQQLRSPVVGGTDMEGFITALSTVTAAAALPTEDVQQLQMILLQQRSQNYLFASDKQKWTTTSANIIDLMEDMRKKAAAELSQVRKAADESKRDFMLTQSSLKAQMKQDKKDSVAQKARNTEATKTKNEAEGQLGALLKELEVMQKSLELVVSDCSQSESDHEETKKAREEELKALLQAKDILQKTLSGKKKEKSELQLAYTFLQLGQTERRKLRRSHRSEPVEIVRKLAKNMKSLELAQLASRMDAEIRSSQRSGEEGPEKFEKVITMINEMIERLERQIGQHLDQAKFCEKELAAAKEDLESATGASSKLTAKLEQATALCATLKDDVEELQEDLVKEQKQQVEMEGIRKEAHDDFVKIKTDLETGLQGLRKAQEVLNDFYGAAGSNKASLIQSSESSDESNDDDSKDMTALMQGTAAEDAPPKPKKLGVAGAGILDVLEVAESDMASDLAKEEAEETEARTEFEKTNQQAKVSIVTKKASMKKKQSHIVDLEKSIEELSSDNTTATDTLAAAKDYDAKMKEKCTVKGETRDEIRVKREKEINGLQDALKVINAHPSGASLLQSRFLGR